MQHPDLSTTVGQLVIENPARARVFEQFGIDYCCGGKNRLDKVCSDREIDVSAVLHELETADASPDNQEPDLSWASLSDLVDHIVSTHHAYLKEELPRLSHLVSKVASAHGDSHPELRDVAQVYESFRLEMEAHMIKEETVLFPMCKMLETLDNRPVFHCGSILNPIHVMEEEHKSAGRDLDNIHSLTNGYTPPKGACNSYRVMLDSLALLEVDTHRHVHKENSILFPLASALEASLPEA